MKYFACVKFDEISAQCSQWAELTSEVFQATTAQNTFFSELAKLSFSDAQTLLAFTAALFATAWVWRLLSKQALR